MTEKKTISCQHYSRAESSLILTSPSTLEASMFWGYLFLLTYLRQRSGIEMCGSYLL